MSRMRWSRRPTNWQQGAVKFVANGLVARRQAPFSVSARALAKATAVLVLLIAGSSCHQGVWIGNIGEITATLDGREVSLEQVGLRYLGEGLVGGGLSCTGGTDCCERMWASIRIVAVEDTLRSECF